MCGIVGAVSLTGERIADLPARLQHMIDKVKHRGPDGSDWWVSDDGVVGLGHTRLAVVDASKSGRQPMEGRNGTRIVFNGEIYNHLELREAATLGGRRFKSRSDTEAILAAYERQGSSCVTELRGMFAFAIWDPDSESLILARDRLGIKPLYVTTVDSVFYFASEAKALIAFLPEVRTHLPALAQYLTFQFTLGTETMFSGIQQLAPGTTLTVHRGNLVETRFWDIAYHIDHGHSDRYFIDRVRSLLTESVDLHLRADVEIGAYVSGGIDSSLIASLASTRSTHKFKAFHGRYLYPRGYDESEYAISVADAAGLDLHVLDLSSTDVISLLSDITYHLDQPTAGPGAIPQFLVSALAARHVKVVLAGQGGDEVFGGYARYLIGYLEQCLRAAIDGTSRNGNFVVTLESIIPNLGALREYHPLLQKFLSRDLFGPLDRRYFSLIERASDLSNFVEWSYFEEGNPYSDYLAIFNSTRNVHSEAYFDSMTHFDFKTLLPALLQVEDRMSMAHGLESRVPMLDHELVEFVATAPADVKFGGGQLKRLLKLAFHDALPPKVLHRRDKMGFPVPLGHWMSGPLGIETKGQLESLRDRALPYLRIGGIGELLDTPGEYSRRVWALLSLEMWHQRFVDGHSRYWRATE